MLIEDLDLPAQSLLSLNFSNSTRETGHSLFQISINDKKCRIPLSLRSNKQNDYRRLASTIIEIIQCNRELLITSTISRLASELYISESNSPLQNLSSGDFQKLITTMTKRGFRLGRCKDYTLESDTESEDRHFLHYFDSLIKDVNTTSIRVSYNKEYHELVQSSKEHFDEMCSMMQDGLFYELGIAFPKIVWEIDNNLKSDEFQFKINDLRYPIAFGLGPGKFLVNDTVDRLLLLNVKGEKAINPANDVECAIISKSDVEHCESAGLTTWDSLGYLILYVSSQLRKRAGSFLTKDVVENDLDSLRLAFPALVDSALSKHDLFNLTWILRDLLDEGISIRDLRSILDNLLMINGITHVDFSKYIVFYPEGTYLVPSDVRVIGDLEFTDYSNYIRATALKRPLSYKYTRGGNTLVVYLLDPKLEDRIRDLRGGMPSETAHNEIIGAIYDEVGNLPPTAQNPVILTSYEIRSEFRKLIEVEFPQLAVLCYQELSADMNIQPIARIGLN